MVTAAALVSGLVAGVTLHYLGSPCLVRPHPLVTANISAVVARGMRAGAEVARDTANCTEVPAGGLVLVAARLQGEAECGA